MADYNVNRGGFLGLLAECGIVMPSTTNPTMFNVAAVGVDSYDGPTPVADNDVPEVFASQRTAEM